MNFQNTAEFAKQLDEQDPLRSFREKFYIPYVNGKECIYLTGNSLGLQPRTTQDHVLNELEDWANYGVEGHLHARKPWVSYHEHFPELLAPIIGALPSEIVVMNQLTVNLHLLMASFYRPDKKRFKILCETKAFPSDQYAITSQAELHGLDPKDVLIEVAAADGSSPTDEEIITAIEKHAGELAVVIIGGVNYYSGRVYDMKRIAAAAHNAGAICGFDLAHAAGNVALEMHDWDVDFACWCSYKYLNSGPGGVAGAFVHQKHHERKDLFRLAGWWGHNKERRFLMERNFDPIPSAESWQLSNAPVLSMAAHYASLEIFREAGADKIFKKGKDLSAYLLYILEDINNRADHKIIRVITPSGEDKHGCQVSMQMLESGKEIFETLKKNGVIADWREPDVIRVAPVPLYNSFTDIYDLGQVIWQVIYAKHH